MNSDLTMTPTRILIVEDNSDDEILLLRQLKKAQLNQHVRVITNGGRALDYLREGRFRAHELVAVFLDFNLPSVSGLELLRVIRTDERLKHLPVILMTSSNAPEILEQSRSLGVSSFVRKPVTFSAFSKALADTFHPPARPCSEISNLAVSVE